MFSLDGATIIYYISTLARYSILVGWFYWHFIGRGSFIDWHQTSEKPPFQRPYSTQGSEIDQHWPLLDTRLFNACFLLPSSADTVLTVRCVLILLSCVAHCLLYLIYIYLPFAESFTIYLHENGSATNMEAEVRLHRTNGEYVLDSAYVLQHNLSVLLSFFF